MRSVTYDGTLAVKNSHFYRGGEVAPASMIGDHHTPITNTVTNTSYGIGHYNTALWLRPNGSSRPQQHKTQEQAQPSYARIPKLRY